MADAEVRAITKGDAVPKEVKDIQQLAYQLEIKALAVAVAAGTSVQAAEKEIKALRRDGEGFLAGRTGDKTRGTGLWGQSVRFKVSSSAAVNDRHK